MVAGSVYSSEVLRHLPPNPLPLSFQRQDRNPGHPSDPVLTLPRVHPETEVERVPGRTRPDGYLTGFEVETV